MHRLPHAEDPTDHRRHQRAQPHVQIHSAFRDGDAEDPKFLQFLPHRQDGRLGKERSQVLAAILTVARCTVEPGRVSQEEGIRKRRETLQPGSGRGSGGGIGN